MSPRIEIPQDFDSLIHPLLFVMIPSMDKPLI